jgi:hypothetical protein
MRVQMLINGYMRVEMTKNRLCFSPDHNFALLIQWRR